MKKVIGREKRSTTLSEVRQVEHINKFFSKDKSRAKESPSVT